MIRRIPLIPSLAVALAVATMVWLGFWQLHRLQWKEELLANYGHAEAMSSDVPWPRTAAEIEGAEYRHSRIVCARVLSIDARAGRSAKGEAGWAHQATCQLADGGTAKVALGWSVEPASPRWAGGEVAGFIGPAGNGIKLVAAPAQAGLKQLAPPNPRDIPNNHLAYAVQWFLFALTALAIYGLALRKRWRERD